MELVSVEISIVFRKIKKYFAKPNQNVQSIKYESFQELSMKTLIFEN